MLEFYPSALHRVMISTREAGERTSARYSIPYFVSPLPHANIEPLPSLVAARGIAVYELVTFNTYAEQMFRATQTSVLKE